MVAAKIFFRLFGFLWYIKIIWNYCRNQGCVFVVFIAERPAMPHHLHPMTRPDFSTDFYVKIQSLLDSGVNMELDCSCMGWKLAVDVVENQEQIIFIAEVAGVKPETIKLIVNENKVQFSGFRSPTCLQSQGFYHRMEIPTGHFCRTLNLPAQVCPQKGQAKITDGILYLILPKQVYCDDNSN
jgi:HSP20 family molecular chaperone IbpA